jgi:hypothetical protein
MMPAMPPLQLSDSTSSKGGSIGGNYVNFGGFGMGAGGVGAGGMVEYWPLLLGGVVLLAILRKK